MSTTNNTNRRNPRRVGLRRQAAPTIDINIAPDQVDDLQRELAEFPDLREIMAYDRDDDGVDGHYGPRTYRAIALIAREAGISPNDIPNINFREKTGDLYTRWHTALQNHHKENETPQQVVQRVEQRQGPTAEQLAAANAAAAEAARLAAEAAARAEANNRVPASIRGTQYDPRYLATLSTPDLINIAKDGLHGIGEISRGFLGLGSYKRNGRLSENVSNKLLEHAHEMGIVPWEQNTLTRRELELTVASLGEATVRRTGFQLAQLPPETNPMNAPVAAAPTNTGNVAPAGPAPLPANARAQADSVREGTRNGESLMVGTERDRQRDQREQERDGRREQFARYEGGEDVNGPEPQRLPDRPVVDRRASDIRIY